MTSLSSDRAAELEVSLAAVRARVAGAAVAAGRDAAQLHLIGVTKGFPVTDLAILVGLGVDEIGESRDQEARPKLAAFEAENPRLARPRVHFIGRLQTNKCRYVVRYADVVHSLDRPELATALSAAAQAREREVDVFVQVSLDGDPERGGVVSDDLPALLAQAAEAPGLRLIGLMAVAPQTLEPEAAFERLARLAERVRIDHPEATALSAGMSGDFEAAIAHGATHVRVGSALLGRRMGTFR